MLNFLKVGISDVSMRCAIDRKDGIHHRSKDKTIQFPIYREGRKELIVNNNYSVGCTMDACTGSKFKTSQTAYKTPFTFGVISFWPFNLHSPEVTDAIKAEKHIVYRKLALTYPGV